MSHLARRRDARVITDGQMVDAFASARRSVFRWESLPGYTEPGEAELMDEWLAGGRGVPTSSRWTDMLARFRASGRSFVRVRVAEDPPTRYQQWLAHVAIEWSVPAGEAVRVMSRATARRVGPIGPGSDWWLIDGRRLVLMVFGPDGRHQRNLLAAGGVAVARARALRVLAVRLSTPVASAGVLRSTT